MQKKLTLKKETLKNLSADLLRKVAGGQLDTTLLQLASAATFEGCNIV